MKNLNGLILKPMRHEKLNLPHSPCENSPGYSFSGCVHEYVMRKAGCQPPWRRFSVEGLPICDNWALLNKYTIENSKVGSDMVKDELIAETKCMFPCTFMEYKVGSEVFLASFIILII